MRNLLDNFHHRKSFVEHINFDEAKTRLVGFYKWLLEQNEIKSILDELKKSVNVNDLVKDCNYNTAPSASNPKEIAAVGFYFLEKISEGTEPYNIADKYGIRALHDPGNLQSNFEELMEKYIKPAFDYIERELEELDDSEDIMNLKSPLTTGTEYPLEISESLRNFKKDYPSYERNAFLMMPFGKTKAHQKILHSIKNTLLKYEINALRADDKEYHDDLYENVLTYLYGCKFGIAVFERLEEDDFNPNVSFEVGYMRGLRKSICLLKDKTLKTLHTDLVGKLYKEFDPQDPEDSIPTVLEKWLRDKDIITL